MFSGVLTWACACTCQQSPGLQLHADQNIVAGANACFVQPPTHLIAIVRHVLYFGIQNAESQDSGTLHACLMLQASAEECNQLVRLQYELAK